MQQSPAASTCATDDCMRASTVMPPSSANSGAGAPLKKEGGTAGATPMATITTCAASCRRGTRVSSADQRVLRKALVGIKYIFAVGKTEGNVEGGVRGDRAQVQHLTVQNRATFPVVAAAAADDGTVRMRGRSISGKRLQPQRPNRSFERVLTGDPTAAAALATVAAHVSRSFTPLHRLKNIAAAERSLHASRHVRPRRARPVRKAGRRGGVAGAVQEDAVAALL